MIIKRIYPLYGIAGCPDEGRIAEATCDICGDDCMKDLFINNDEGDHNNEDDFKEFEGMQLDAIWGFSSNKDGEIWNGVICEKCVDKHLVPIINFLKKPYN